MPPFAPAPETPLRGLDLAVWDTETTGLDPWAGARILQIAVVHHRLGEDAPVLVYQSYVDPLGPVPVQASNVHHITTEKVAELRAEGRMPTWQQVAPLFRSACEERVSAGYNIGFDADFVRHHHGHPKGGAPRSLDAMLLSRRLMGGLERYRLINVADALGVPLVGAHEAAVDALATARVLACLLPLAERAGIRTLGEALEAQEAERARAAAHYRSRTPKS
jgi:DNA polymerase-3 subunit epsilon